MYIEWGDDSDDLRLVSRIHLNVSDTCDEGTVSVKTADHDRTILFMGDEKAARRVFCGIRKRLGAGGVIITGKWIKKIAAD